MKAPPAQHRAVDVRPWSPQDDAFVEAMAEEAFGEYGARAGPYLLGMTHRASNRSWVATLGDEQVGLVVLGRDAQTWWVLAVAVIAKARACGVGKQLMQIAERHAVAQGGGKLSLFTADSNLAALDLFLRRGFRITGHRRHFYSRRQDACELVKTLRCDQA